MEIILNGKIEKVESETISFEDIRTRLGLNLKSVPTVIWQDLISEGTLLPGECLVVVPALIISATVTDNG